MHNISSSVLSDIIHSAFPVHCRAVLLVPTPGVTPHHRCNLLQHKIYFPPAPAFGLPKKKNGGGDTSGSWIEQRHRQSNLHHRDTFFSSSPVQLLLGILPQLGVLDTDCLTWQGWIIRAMIPSVGHRNCRIHHRCCRLLLAHWRAGRSSELNGRGGRHLDYCAVLRVPLFGVFLSFSRCNPDTHSCNFHRVLKNQKWRSNFASHLHPDFTYLTGSHRLHYSNCNTILNQRLTRWSGDVDLQLSPAASTLHNQRCVTPDAEIRSCDCRHSGI